MGFFNKLFGKKEKETLDQGLQKTKEGFLSKLTKAVAGKSTVDEEVLDDLEDALVSADVGVDTTIEIIKIKKPSPLSDSYIITLRLWRSWVYYFCARNSFTLSLCTIASLKL